MQNYLMRSENYPLSANKQMTMKEDLESLQEQVSATRERHARAQAEAMKEEERVNKK